jgi:hypothetical protein
MPIGKNDHQLPVSVRDSFSERPSNLDSLDDDCEVSKMVSLEALNSSDAEAEKKGWLATLCCLRRRDGHRELERDSEFEARASA